MMVGVQGETPEVVGRCLNILCGTYSDTTNVEYALMCTRPGIVANGEGVPHLGAVGRRAWPKT